MKLMYDQRPCRQITIDACEAVRYMVNPLYLGECRCNIIYNL